MLVVGQKISRPRSLIWKTKIVFLLWAFCSHLVGRGGGHGLGWHRLKKEIIPATRFSIVEKIPQARINRGQMRTKRRFSMRMVRMQQNKNLLLTENLIFTASVFSNDFWFIGILPQKESAGSLKFAKFCPLFVSRGRQHEQAGPWLNGQRERKCLRRNRKMNKQLF